MDRFYIKFAESHIRRAKNSLLSDDEFDLRMAAFEVEQAIELTLKQALIEYGVDFKKHHVFRTLISLLPDGQDVISQAMLDRLSDNADRLTNWATEIKYTESYIATRREIERMWLFADEFCREVKDNISMEVVCSPKPTIKKMNFD